MKKIVIVARDVGPSESLVKLHQALLADHGFEVRVFLGEGKPFGEPIAEIIRAVTKSNLVILGMSCSTEFSREEIAAGEEAARRGIPFGLYADTYDAHNRGWFEPLREATGFLFVINKEEAQKAKKVFPKAEIVASGNPMWEEFAFPKLSPDAARKKLGASTKETVILCPGGKSLVVNVLLFGNVIEAVHSPSLLSKKPRIILSLHPADLNDPELYNDLAKFSEVPVKILSGRSISTLDILPGVNLLVESVSTIGIAAAFQRIPVIDFFTEIALSRIETVKGTRHWEPCELGVARAVYGSVDELKATMARLLTQEGFAPMLERQKAVYQKPERKGATIRKMISYIEKIV